jgi:hypothetical protein
VIRFVNRIWLKRSDKRRARPGYGWTSGKILRAAGSQRESRAPTALNGARELAMKTDLDYGAAGLAAAAGLSAVLGAAAALAASAGAAADAAASGAAGAVSSDLLQAVANNIETSARSRTLRIAFSLGWVGAQLSAQTRNAARIR